MLKFFFYLLYKKLISTFVAEFYNLNCDEKHKFKTISISIGRIISC